MDELAISIPQTIPLKISVKNPLEISNTNVAKPMPQDVDDEIMDFARSPTMPIPSIDISDDNASCISETPAYNLETYLAERQLIRLVSKQSALYNCKHRRFTDDAHKEALWQKIAKQLSLEKDMCKGTWAKLRHRYQRHVRLLRKYRRQSQASRIYTRPRPTMLYEEDMLFLYTHVSRYPQLLSEKPRMSSVPALVDDDVVVLTQPAEIIDLDEDECEPYPYKIMPDQQRLVDAVRAYPLLYDPYHPNYNNYCHRGLIWGAISNELREKATKLMKIWIQLKTRYEWETLHMNDKNSPVMQHLNFLAPYILNTPGTVYKMSLYLRDGWIDHIEHFRSVMNLINVLKVLPELGQMVDDHLDNDRKPQRYHELWLRVSSQVNCNHQRCEVTWLILRNFYMELTEMRKVGYQLKDKWFFENIISCLYRVHNNRNTRRAQKRAALKIADAAPPAKQALTSKSPSHFGIVYPPPKPVITQAKPLAPLPTPPPPPLPLAIVYPPKVNISNTHPIPIAIGETSSASTSITNTINTTINTTINSTVNTSSSITTNTMTTAANFTIPRITAAISMMPKPVVPPMPPIINPALNNMKIMTKSLSGPESTSVQLANTIGQATSLRPGLQVMVRPNIRQPISSTFLPPGSVIRPIAPGSLGVQLGTSTTIRPINPVSVAMGTWDMTNTITSTITMPTIPGSIPNNFGAAAAPSGLGVPRVAMPVPKLVPLSVRNDKVSLTPVNNKPMVTLPLTTSTTPSTSTLASAAASPPALIRQKSNIVTSGYDEMRTHLPSKTSTPKAYPNTNATQSINEFKVEFIENKDTGRILSVTGHLSKVELNMSRVSNYIREILAIPQLHCGDPQMANRCTEIWLLLSKKLHIHHAMLRSIWAFLSSNINLFPHIAPMVELMRPFKTNIKVWEKSHRLFSKFDEIARKYQWMYHKESLPPLMQLFEKHDHLYWDMRRRTVLPLPPITEEKRQKVWHEARDRFPHINHHDVWSMFKFAFKTYMEDLERGIENPWPQNWWHALAKLRFLINVRYHPLEPYYYIVHNKFMEEVKRCSMYETLMQPATPGVVAKKAHTPIILTMPWETPEGRTLYTNSINQPNANVLHPTHNQHQNNNNSNQQQLCLASNSVDLTEPDDCDEVINVDELPTVNELETHMASQSYGRFLPSIESYQLTRLLRCNPNTIGIATASQKRAAWVNVAKKLNATVSECRLSLQHAVRELRILKIADPNGQYTMSHKYYRHMRCIYNQVTEGGFTKASDSSKLEQLVMEPIERVFPERYLPEINMITCKPSLVVKNWAYALGNLHNQDLFKIRIRQIFKKYAPPGTMD